jgi:hypothetical protein
MEIVMRCFDSITSIRRLWKLFGRACNALLVVAALSIFGCEKSATPTTDRDSLTPAKKLLSLEGRTTDRALERHYDELLARLSQRFGTTQSEIAAVTWKAKELLRTEQNVYVSFEDLLEMADNTMAGSTSPVKYPELMALYVTQRQNRNHQETVLTISAMFRSMGLETNDEGAPIPSTSLPAMVP